MIIKERHDHLIGEQQCQQQERDQPPVEGKPPQRGHAIDAFRRAAAETADTHACSSDVPSAGIPAQFAGKAERPREPGRTAIGGRGGATSIGTHDASRASCEPAASIGGAESPAADLGTCGGSAKTAPVRPSLGTAIAWLRQIQDDSAGLLA